MCPGKLEKRFGWFGILFFFSLIPLKGQLLQDTAALRIVKEDIDHVYNFQFSEARIDYARIVDLYPSHPIVYLLRGIFTYWENYPMLHTSPAHVLFEEDMKACIKLSEKNTNKAYDAEYLLADLCARGMLLMFYDDNDLIMEVTPLTISTYKYLRRAFNYSSACSDLYYFTGTYNYYREAFPRAYPVYKSLAFLFPHGNLETGLRELQKASSSSIVLRAESSFLLAWIYLSFENKLNESTVYCKKLYDTHSNNPVYLGLYIRNLLLTRNYDEAETLIEKYPHENLGKYFEAQEKILRGILYEKKYRDFKQAEQYYNEGISEITIYGKFAREFEAYAYFGLSRISTDDGEKHTRKTYRKEAMKLADFKKINFDK